MKTLVLNSTNVVNDGFNNKLTYNFPNGGVNLSGYEVAVNTIQIYFSWFNISSTLYNNSAFSYKWFDGQTYNVQIPDGYYQVDDLNNFLEATFLTNNHYMIDNQHNPIYFISLQTNPTFYAIQLTCSPLSSALATTWTKPAGATWNVPAAPVTPYFNVLSNGLQTILGFNAGQFPSTPQASTFYQNSQYCPEEQPVSSILVSTSLVSNPLSVPSNIIYSFAPDVDFGSLISSKAYTYAWADVVGGHYSQFTLSFIDQNYQPIKILDKAMVVTLVFREKNSN